ncbi:MAG: hypothetical protein GXO10_00410 [Crenarchaeota archaeon]|nr:hypothetical protein [Thermoproteota archaeon]
MCRILAYYGSTNKRIIEEILDSLLRVSKHDVIGTLSGIDDFHPDGWGIYVRYRSGEAYARSSNAVFDEENIVRTLIRSYVDVANKIMIILHIRAASQGEPHGVDHSHPYMLQDGEIKLVLAHNGAVKKRDILRDIGKEHLAEKVTDSMALTMYIFEKLKKGIDISETILDVMERYTKTALMTSIFIDYGYRMELIVTSHVSERMRHRIEYYRLYKLNLNETVIYLSSSLAHEISSHSLSLRSVNIMPLPVDRYYEINRVVL